MRVSKEEFMEKLKSYIGDRTDDDSISLLEDFSDSFENESSGDWKVKFEENDRMWRERYIARFTGETNDETSSRREVNSEMGESEEKDYTYESLFRETE